MVSHGLIPQYDDDYDVFGHGGWLHKDSDTPPATVDASNKRRRIAEAGEDMTKAGNHCKGPDTTQGEGQGKMPGSSNDHNAVRAPASVWMACGTAGTNLAKRARRWTV